MAHTINDADWNDFKRLLTDYRAGRLKNGPGGRRPVPGGRPNIRAILLEDLDNGGDAEAAVTKRQFVSEVQTIDLLGTVDGGDFVLSFEGEQTAAIDHNATAAELQAILEGLSGINSGDLTVTAYEGRWLVEFTGQFAGEDPPNLAVVSNNLEGGFNTVRVSPLFAWVDAGRTESIHGQIPVGIPTPLQAGIVISAGWFPEAASYGVLNAECRDLVYGS